EGVFHRDPVAERLGESQRDRALPSGQALRARLEGRAAEIGAYRSFRLAGSEVPQQMEARIEQMVGLFGTALEDPAITQVVQHLAARRARLEGHELARMF